MSNSFEHGNSLINLERNSFDVVTPSHVFVNCYPEILESAGAFECCYVIYDLIYAITAANLTRTSY